MITSLGVALIKIESGNSLKNSLPLTKSQENFTKNLFKFNILR